MEKNWGKKNMHVCVCVCMWMNHFVVCLKLTQLINQLYFNLKKIFKPTKVINIPNLLLPIYLHFTTIAVPEVPALQVPSSTLPPSSPPPVLGIAAVCCTYICAISMLLFCFCNSLTPVKINPYIKFSLLIVFVFLTDVTSQHKCSPNDANGLRDGRRQSIFISPNYKRPRLICLFWLPQDFILENWPSQRMQESRACLGPKGSTEKKQGEKNIGIYIYVCVYVWVTKSLCCTSETNTTL